MRRHHLLRAALLALALLLLFGGASGAVWADGPSSGTASVGWVVIAKDGEGNDQTLSSADDVAAALGGGFSLKYGSSTASPTVADLRSGGVKITPPAGYSVKSVFLVAEGGSAASGSRSLVSLAAPSLDGSGAITLPAAIFAADYDTSSVGAVFNGSGESYVFQIVLDRLSAGGNVTLSYKPGALAGVLGDAELVPGGNTASLPRGSGSYASGTVAALSKSVNTTALSTYAKEFTGWKLVLSNGASVLLRGGESISLSSSATLEAQWRDAIVFTFTGGEKIYDGDPLTGSYSRSGQLKEGDTLVIPDEAVTLSRTEAGDSTATLDIDRVRVTRGETDVTSEYHFVVLPAELHVLKRSVTYTVTDVKVEYDGTAHAPTASTLTSGTLANGHSASAAYSGQQTVPGSSTGAAKFTITDGDGSDVTANYNVSVINGTIEVSVRSEKQPLTVKISDTEKEYDGTSDVTAAYAIVSGSLLGSDKLVAGTVFGSITGVGTGTVNGSFSVFNGDTNVSDNYEITVSAGKLTVKPRFITLTADSAEKDFDGTPLTKASFTITAGSLIEGHNVTATVTGSQTNAGTSANKIDDKSVQVTDAAGNNVTGLYSILLAEGKLTVKGPAATTALTVTMKDAEKVYDGKALSSKEFTLSSGTLAEGDTLVIGEVTGSQTAAGSSAVSAVFTVKHGEADVTANYTITVVAGKLTVKPRPITITAGSASKVYDGRALYSSSYKVSSGELVKGHKLKAEVSGSRTEIGSSANVVVKSSIKITDSSGKDVTANYNITTAAGTLTITDDPISPITLSIGDTSKVYDGKPYRFLSDDIKVTSGTLPAGYRIEATFNPEAPTDAGKYEVTIKSVTIRDASGANVTSRFNITRLKGTLTITARPLVIETKAANKVYDGTALTERSTPNITGRAEGHQVTLRITGTQTRVGSSENTVSDVKITDKETGADVTKNYAISYQYGLLTVSESAENDGGDTYNWVNGSAGTLYIHFDHGYDGFEGLLVDGKELDRSAYTSASGSTDIWLKASYLNTLSSGEHTLTAKYTGGETMDTSFSVKETQATRSGRGNSRMVLWLVILATAFLGFFAAVWYLLLGKDLRWKKRPGKKVK